MSEQVTYGVVPRAFHLEQAKRALPGVAYYVVLHWLHQIVEPATYVEIGVQNGDSLMLARAGTLSVGIDPSPTLRTTLSPNARVFAMTSNEFFEQYDLRETLLGNHVAMAFVDGLHLFEQALLDFSRLERYSMPSSIIVVHDCLPLDEITSSRTRTTDFYSGDVWKVALCLRELRPDLHIAIVPAAPTGLCIISGLNPASTVLERSYEACLARYRDLDFEDYRMRARLMPPTIPNTKAAVNSFIRDARAACRRALGL